MASSLSAAMAVPSVHGSWILWLDLCRVAMISRWGTLMLMVLPSSCLDLTVFGQAIWWYRNPCNRADSGVVILLPREPSQWPRVLEKVSAGASARGLGYLRKVSESLSSMG